MSAESNELDPESLYDEEPANLGTSATVEAADAPKRTRQKTKRRLAEPEVDGDGVVFVYEPHVAVVPPLRNYFRELWNRRAFLNELAKSEVRGQRSSTPLGSFWAILDPLFMAMIYFFLFTIIRSGEGRTADFVPLIVAGMLHFGLTTAALGEGAGVINSSKTLMLNTTFPRAILPLSVVYKGLLKYWPGVPIIFIFVIAMNGIDSINLNALWLAPILLVQIIGAIGFALITSTVTVFVPDMKNLMQYISRVFFFTTPVIWPYYVLPENLLEILKWQPLFGIFYGYQRLFAGLQPNLVYLLISTVWSIVLIVFGFWIFLRSERKFASKI